MKKPREGEVIGGGYFVFRRGKKTGRVGVRYCTLPYEHGSYESAVKEVERLTALNPGERYVVFSEVTPL